MEKIDDRVRKTSTVGGLSIDDINAGDRREGWDTVTRFLNDLLFDPDWLRTSAESEQEIAAKLGASKSSARETAIALMRIGALDRVASGIRRKTLSVEQLIPLYALRLRIELQAFAQIFTMSPAKREGLAVDLSAVLARQEQRHRAKDFIGWLQQGIHFHTQLVSRADFSDLSNILQNLMLQIRIGSFRTHDLPSVRTTVMEEHEAYLKLIADGSHKGFTKWSDVIQEHILKSFAIAAQVSVAEDPTKAISKFRESPIWQTTCLLAVANPIVRGDEAIKNK